MNRCITCYRCVRYYRDYAGGTDLTALGSRGRMYFGRVEEGTLENEFAGNLVEVCPTGVFTDKPFSKQYSRKWDLQSAPSVCPGCAVGCNTFPSERYGVLKRLQNRYHGEVNGYFLCDRGRFGSHFVNSDKRLRQAGLRAADGVFEANGRDAAVSAAAQLVDDRTIGIGSPRASVEANFALKSLVGEDNFCTGLSDVDAELVNLALSIYGQGGPRIASLKDVEAADAVLILGEDVLNTAPRVALALRQTVRAESFDMAQHAGIPDWQDAGVRGHAQHALSPLFIATATSTRIDDIATATTGAAPQDIARLGAGIANGIDAGMPRGADNEFTQRAAEALAGAKRPLVISGTGSANADVMRSAANVARALKSNGADAMLMLVPGEVNSFGVGMLRGGLSMSEALAALAGGGNAIVLENDLFRRADSELVEQALTGGNTAVLDVLETATAELAGIVLPAASYAENTGTFVNYETRAQRFYQVFEPTDEIAPAWRWISAIAAEAGRENCRFDHIDELVASTAAAPGLGGIADVAPTADYRVEAHAKIPREPHRYSGRTAMRANVSVHEPKTTVDEETPFSYSMEGQNIGKQDGAVVPYVWSPGWNSNQSVFKFQQEVGGLLTGGDVGVRLIDESDVTGEAFTNVPDAYVADGSFQAVPVQSIFGSDELSGASWPVLQRTPAPFAVLNPEDAKRLQVVEGGGVKSSALPASVEVRIDARVAPGVVGILAGVAGSRTVRGAIELSADPDFVRRPGGDPNVIAKG